MIRIGITKVVVHHAEVIASVGMASVGPVVRCCALVEREAKMLVGISAGKPPVASAPGQPPHLRSGDLRASISSALVSMVPAGGIVGPTEIYGKWQEFGTKDGKLPKRPFMRPALARTRGMFPLQFVNLKLRRVRGV